MNRFLNAFQRPRRPGQAPRSAPHASFVRAVLNGILIVVLTPAIAAQGPEISARKPAASIDGFAAFRDGRYDDAIEAFAAAWRQKPDDPYLCYNYGCALYAVGDDAGAKERFRDAATARDRAVSDRARSLLAGIEVRRAATALSDPPEETPPGQREAVLASVAEAESWYEAILSDGSGDEEVRRNLERLRLWKARMQRHWDARDRSRLLESGLPDYLTALRDRQAELRHSVSKSVPSSPSRPSPRQMQEFYLNAKRQGELGEDLRLFKDALREEAHRQTERDDGNAGPASREIPALLDAMFAPLERDCDEAAGALRGFRPGEAVEPQKRFAEGLERLFETLAPYEILLMDMHRREAAALDGGDRLGTASPAPPEGETPEPEAIVPVTAEECRENAWEQEMLARSLQGLLEKAREGVARLSVESGTPPTSPPGRPHAIPESPFATDDPFAAPREGPDAQDGTEGEGDPQTRQREKLLESMNLALQYGGELDGHFRGAAEQWAAENEADATAHQQHALKLLEIIMEPLRDEQENSQQDNGGEDAQDKQDGQDQQDGQDDPREKDDSGDGGRDENGDDRDGDASDENQDKEKSNGQSEDDGADGSDGDTKRESPERTAQDERQRQAEQGLRQVRQRQRQAEEIRERIRAYLRQAVPVEKDW